MYLIVLLLYIYIYIYIHTHTLISISKLCTERYTYDQSGGLSDAAASDSSRSECSRHHGRPGVEAMRAVRISGVQLAARRVHRGLQCTGSAWGLRGGHDRGTPRHMGGM